jgi:hypothetical protein
MGTLRIPGREAEPADDRDTASRAFCKGVADRSVGDSRAKAGGETRHLGARAPHALKN